MKASLDLSDEDDQALLADINVTPLVDVMLVLLIVFMVAAPLMVHGVRLDLPKSGGASLGPPAKPLVASLTRTGEVFLRDQKVAGLELSSRLLALRSSEGDPFVYVRADRSVAYGNVMDLVGQFGAAGFTKVSLLSQPGGSKN